jgi:hypothetical protein
MKIVHNESNVKDLVQFAEINRSRIHKNSTKNLEMVGCTYKTNNWGDIEILEYRGDSKFLIKFQNTGNILETYKVSILSGRVADRDRREQMKADALKTYPTSVIKNSARLDWPQRDGGEIEVLEFCSETLDLLLRNKSGIVNKVPYVQFKAGALNTDTLELREDFRIESGRFRFGIKDTETISREAYRKWGRIINSCYNTNNLIMHPSYLNVTVSEEWRYFSNFQHWFIEHYKEGASIEKDLLSPLDDKKYSPETCVFVSGTLNSELSLHRDSYRRTGYIGVDLTDSGTFSVRLKNEDGKKITVGTYDNIEIAHKVWQYAKADVLECKLKKGDYAEYDRNIVEQIIAKLRYNAENDIVSERLSI